MSHFCDLTSWVIPHFDKIIHSVWFEALKLHLPVLQIWAGSIYRSRFLTTGSQIVLLPLPYFSGNPSLGACGCCWNGLWSLLRMCFSHLYFDLLVQVPQRLSPSICSTQHSDPHAWPGPVHRMLRLLLTCVVGNRFCPQRGTAIVSWSPELLYLGRESLLTHKHGTTSHSIPSLKGSPSSHIGLLAGHTDTVYLFVFCLFFFHGFFSKPPWISTHAGRCFGDVVRVHPDSLPKASKFYLASSPNTEQHVDRKTQ